VWSRRNSSADSLGERQIQKTEGRRETDDCRTSITITKKVEPRKKNTKRKKRRELMTANRRGRKEMGEGQKKGGKEENCEGSNFKGKN